MRFRHRLGALERRRLFDRTAQRMAAAFLVNKGLALIEAEGLPADLDTPTVLVPGTPEPAGFEVWDLITNAEGDATIARLSERFGIPRGRIVALAAARGARAYSKASEERVG